MKLVFGIAAVVAFLLAAIFIFLEVTAVSPLGLIALGLALFAAHHLPHLAGYARELASRIMGTESRRTQ